MVPKQSSGVPMMASVSDDRLVSKGGRALGR